MDYSADYDKALYYTYQNEWDQLLILMVRTKDDFLSKKIEHFLHACHYRKSIKEIEEAQEALFRYLDHAVVSIPEHAESPY